MAWQWVLHGVMSCTVKDSVKDYVPVDTLIDINKLLVLLMFRLVMVHVLGTYVFLSRTIFNVQIELTN